MPIFNYAVGYDLNNSEPLMYEKYPGSIIDVSQLQFMVVKIKGYGYRNIGFILDRGYFSKENLRYMDSNGFSFIIMVKGCKEFIPALRRDLLELSYTMECEPEEYEMMDHELEACYEKYKRILKNLTIMSDVFMRNVFKERRCTEYVLQVISTARFWRNVCTN